MTWGRRRFFAAIARGFALVVAPLKGRPSALTAAPRQPPRAQPRTIASRSRTRLDEGWRFTRTEASASTETEPAAPGFNDGSWQQVTLPHDYAIAGPFTTSGGGGMGRLPTAGRVWYRRSLTLLASATGRSLFLDIDGAMSHSQVWLNGQLVGGWPYGYASYRVDLTPHARPGAVNVLAIRLDNPPNSSRWYPGGGLYRNLWLVESSPVHVGQWGTFVTTSGVSAASADIALALTIDNDSSTTEARATVETRIFELKPDDRRGPQVAVIPAVSVVIPRRSSTTADTRAQIRNPKLWGVAPRGMPNRYVALTVVRQDGAIADIYETPFGIRTIRFDPDAGFVLNGERVQLQGVCNHHDLGALGAAINVRAIQRQLQMLADMGCNALRTAHNPPAPELLDLTDRMGFLIMDEAFDSWARQKTPNDYHLEFAEWHERDLRGMIRRDRNHPSVIMWSIGNEVGEQTTGADGAWQARNLTRICHEEDPTRPTISGMNSARADGPFTAPIDTIGLNYQGAGLFRGTPQYPPFHKAFPGKFMVGSETAATLSSRGVYTFPVADAAGTPASATAGQDVANRQVSSYDVYHASWSYTPEKEFAALERFPYVGGEFVWTGWDYLGEPTPFNASRSSYFGIIDLAGFKKDRFYLYQSHWRPDLPMAHIVPHWTWPDRIGQVTPVHVYTSGTEAELFLNGKSLGRKRKGQFEYRLRWDEVVYEPGELRAVAYKDGKKWASDSVATAGNVSQLIVSADRTPVSPKLRSSEGGPIAADGKDLSFVTVTMADERGRLVPRSMNTVTFTVSGPGEIVATDNGDPTDMTPFPSPTRKAFNGLALAIVRGKRGQRGRIIVSVKSEGLRDGHVIVEAR